MLGRAPEVIVYTLLRDGWTPANTSYPGVPRIHSGWWDYATAAAGGTVPPTVTVTNPDEGTVAGGLTGQTAGTGSGGVSQVRAGTLDVNAWAGRREDCTGIGVGGADVNPKQLAWEMGVEVHRIIQEHAGGTLAPTTGAQELTALGADGMRMPPPSADDSLNQAVFRRHVTVRYGYVTQTF